MLRYSLIFYLLICMSCTENASESGKTIVDNSIEAHGGIEFFQDLKSVSFVKTTRLFLEDGTLESETFQKQAFQLNPDYSVTMKWEQDSIAHEIVYDLKTNIKKVNDSVITNPIEVEKARKMAMAADYVFFQPFKLAGNNAVLKYEGTQMIGDSIETSVVGIKYEDDTNESDSWKYYFNKNYRLIAASVKHNNRISLIENLEFQHYKGVLFNKHRKSFFVDSLFQKKQLRAEYFYEIIETRQ